MGDKRLVHGNIMKLLLCLANIAHLNIALGYKGSHFGVKTNAAAACGNVVA